MNLLNVRAHDAVDRLEPGERAPHPRIAEFAEQGLQRPTLSSAHARLSRGELNVVQT